MHEEARSRAVSRIEMLSAHEQTPCGACNRRKLLAAREEDRPRAFRRNKLLFADGEVPSRAVGRRKLLRVREEACLRATDRKQLLRARGWPPSRAPSRIQLEGSSHAQIAGGFCWLHVGELHIRALSRMNLLLAVEEAR